MERKKAHMDTVCVCTPTEGKRLVKRQCSDQRRDESMEEAKGGGGGTRESVRSTV